MKKNSKPLKRIAQLGKRDFESCKFSRHNSLHEGRALLWLAHRLASLVAMTTIYPIWRRASDSRRWWKAGLRFE